jgi:hypothetical protein
MAQQQGNQGAGCALGTPRQGQTGGAGNTDLHIFDSLGASLGVVFEGVSGLARSAADLLPISGEHERGKAPAAHSSSTARATPQVSSHTLFDSPRTSARSKASTKLRVKGGVTRTAAEDYHVAETDRLRRRRGSSPSLDVSGAHRAAVEQRMWESLPSARDGLRVPKPRDPCDKATHSKISSWMSKAESAPLPPPTESGGGLMLFNKLLAGVGLKEGGAGGMEGCTGLG